MGPRTSPGDHHSDQDDVRKPGEQAARAEDESGFEVRHGRRFRGGAPPNWRIVLGRQTSRTGTESRRRPAPRSDPVDRDLDSAPPATARGCRKASPQSRGATLRSYRPIRLPDRSAPRAAATPAWQRCFHRSGKRHQGKAGYGGEAQDGRAESAVGDGRIVGQGRDADGIESVIPRPTRIGTTTAHG